MSNPNVLFLDDDDQRWRMFRREFPFAYRTATAGETIAQLESRVEPVDWLFLDHDLGGETFVSSDRSDCGMEVVRWIEAHRPKVTKMIVVHSHNGPAATEMARRLRDAGYTAMRISFGWLDFADVRKAMGVAA